ncbi:TPA: helix-turn-helix transcriptional regulator [Vibrio vulnificus]|nr:helix-turn-helix transcriptional regulator [Vibrio vulnificus]EKO5173094.1 helix-turn-helix transcriptional regulator [Vibrio vulnificus]EKO5192621.1 helix-turn-helix transcriptional regulator [Vibrio vulnificus]MCU8134963.1 helix-turn-helix transcriptional regulator [Vibrio vulnificus]HAS8479892.1 helix-turn-helix transcriptional regulator [Vibrio vulnificus]
MTKETIGERIRRVRKELKLTQQDVAKSVGVSPTSMVFWERGETTPKGSNLIALCKKLKVDPQWLQTGKGPREHKEQANAELLGNMQVWDSSTPLGNDEVAIPFLVDVKLSAGNGFVCNEEEDQGFRLRFAKSTLRRYNVEAQNAKCVSVKGDSMEPVLPDGSTVGIDCGNKALIDGKIYAINHNNELFIKKLYRLPGGGLRIYSFNEAEYPAREYTAEQANEQKITIIGRVFWYSVLL